MALIVENGSLVANANSYVDLSFFNNYLTTFGVSYTGNDAAKEILLLKSMQYLESFRSRFKGSKVASTQSLQWPRIDVVIDGFDVLETTIPVELKNMQCQLAVEQIAGKPLFPLPKTSTSEGAVIEKTIGPLTKKFASPSKSYPQVSTYEPIVFASVQIYLNVLLKSCQYLETVRV